MPNATQSLRAFRPSVFGDPDVLEERLTDWIRQRNVARYTRMASQGLPLFTPDPRREEREVDAQQT
jgi:hypothetical protein